MYYPDLSPYSYHNNKFAEEIKTRYGLSSNTQVLNIGWLDPAFPFETEVPDSAFLAKLWERMQQKANFMRGIHTCPFLDLHHEFLVNPNEPDFLWVRAVVNGEEASLGSCEIFVLAPNTFFIAPDLVYHYIAEHHYKPPQVFYDAVMAS